MKKTQIRASQLREGDHFKLSGANCEIVRVQSNDINGYIVEFYSSLTPLVIAVMIAHRSMLFNVYDRRP